MDNFNIGALEGLIPLIAGVWMTLLGVGVFKGRNPRQVEKYRKYIRIGGPLLIVFGVFQLGGGFFIPAASEKMDLQVVAGQVREKLKLPLFVDADTRLDDVRPINSTILGYFLTLVNYKHSDPKLAPLLKEIEKNVQSSACANPNYKTFFNSNIHLSFSYRSMDNIEVLKIIISPESCQK
jgi:hypothetical protein